MSFINGFEKLPRALIQERVQSVKARWTKKAAKQALLEDLDLGIDEVVPVDDEDSGKEDSQQEGPNSSCCLRAPERFFAWAFILFGFVVMLYWFSCARD
jgi:predicted enzyme involved in methoxymalonyl-ACP biosynthesis